MFLFLPKDFTVLDLKYVANKKRLFYLIRFLEY